MTEKYELSFEQVAHGELQSQGIKINGQHYLISEAGTSIGSEGRKSAFNALSKAIRKMNHTKGKLEIITE
jgi:hypothetical protein